MTLIHHYHVQIHVQDQTPEWLVKYTGNQIFFERKILLENQEKLHNLQNIHIYVGLQPPSAALISLLLSHQFIFNAKEKAIF